MTVDVEHSLFGPGEFRQVLGHFATGVAVITADGDAGTAGMVVSSFTSVSLDPPLVAFLPDKKSTSWPDIERVGHFCVNILRSDQLELARQFARKGGDKFADVSWQPAPSGAPILDGVVAWIDCELSQTFESGDHYIAIGRVTHLEAAEPGQPLVFFQGGYGEFARRDPAEGPLQRAVQVLAARGLDEASFQEIATATGLPVEEVRRQAVLKDEVVDELVGGYLLDVRDRSVAVLDSGVSGSEVIAGLLRTAFEAMHRNPVAIVVLENEREHLARTPQLKRLEPLEQSLQGTWITALRRGIDDGVFRADLDVALTYRFIRDVLFTAARWYRPDGPYTASALAERYTDLILHGVSR